ncbi:hypothetical protein BDZ85DRAFT_266080 [Elsinoe ampelina]|uniref:RBR-type E3 ubiquitin transferase n=1 Tax=Elsinoe ampelina TaxID=302913 RepID=A0A6A6G5Z1_9PEZI|nr:hypothetical protein BDZ85DRAFT_266080 [Elsinoe ampelina]
MSRASCKLTTCFEASSSSYIPSFTFHQLQTSINIFCNSQSLSHSSMAPNKPSGSRPSLPRQAKTNVQSYAGQDGPSHRVTKKRSKAKTTTAATPIPAQQPRPRVRRGVIRLPTQVQAMPPPPPPPATQNPPQRVYPGRRPRPRPAVPTMPLPLVQVRARTTAAPVPPPASRPPYCQLCGDGGEDMELLKQGDVPEACSSHVSSACKPCVIRHARSAFQRGSLPHCAFCGIRWEFGQAAMLFDAAETEIFESRLSNRAIETDPMFRWCAQDKCPSGQIYVADLVTEDPKVCCNSCESVNCFSCRTIWHEGISCKDHQDPVKREEALLKDYKETLGTMRKAVTKRCPTCGCGVEKTDGCNHMTCANCSADFNWDLASIV